MVYLGVIPFLIPEQEERDRCLKAKGISSVPGISFVVSGVKPACDAACGDADDLSVQRRPMAK